MPDPSSSEAAGRRMAGPPLGGVGTGAGLLEKEGPETPSSNRNTVVPWPIAIGARSNIARRAAVARKIALFTPPPSLGMCPLLLAPPSMPHDEAWRISTEAYSPKCVEGFFSEVGLPLNGVLRSSSRTM
jgi:hypothetical protein